MWMVSCITCSALAQAPEADAGMAQVEDPTLSHETEPQPSAASPSGDSSGQQNEANEAEPSDGGAAMTEPPQEPTEATAQEASDGTPETTTSSEPPATSGKSGPTTICEGRTISKIKIRGYGRVSADDILATIQLRNGLPCTDSEVTRDARALWDLGYFRDVRVEGKPRGANKIELIFIVQERPAIGEVTFDGNDALDKSDLEEKVTLRQGAVLSEPAVKKELEKIRQLYAEKGYFLAKVHYELDPMPHHETRVRFVIEEGEEVTVRRIRFLGNTSLADSDIKKYMQTGETSVFSIISSNDAYRREVFDQDLTTIQALYYDKGYLMVEVDTPQVELSPDRRYIDISIPVTEGPRFRVGRVHVAELGDDGEEIEPLGGRRLLRESVTLDPGDWFSRTTIAENLQTITRYYRDRGYARVQVVPQTDLNPDTRIVNVSVTVRRGPLVYIQRINFSGNTKTRDAVLRRELRVVEGQLYNQSLVELSKERITALGYFESVTVAEEDGSDVDRLVLNYQIAEKATGTFQLGAGFSSQETFLLTGQIQQQNLFGRGQSLSLNLQLSGIRQMVQVQFIEPYFYGTDWTAMLDLFKILRQQASFDRDSTGASVTLGHPILGSLFDTRLRMFANYNVEYVSISPASGGVLGTGIGQNFALYQPVPLANLFRDGLTNSGRLSLQWDTRNNRLFPTEGIFATASTEAGLITSPDTAAADFFRHRLNVRFYHPVIWQLIAKLNVEWGLISSYSSVGVPIYERYFLGGITDVRGFRMQSIGPRMGQTSQTDPLAAPATVGIPFGGNMQFYYNFELEFPILDSVGIRGVLFQDGGNAWNLEQRLEGPDPILNDAASSTRGADLLHLRTSWGFGIRWFSPLGPLRFEWGFPIFRRALYEDVYQFQFMVGNAF